MKHGFSGLVVTDHLHPEYLSRIDTEHDWQKAMDHYLSGYKASKKRGDELGFDVILGAELRFPLNDNDYLVYGIDEDWLRSNPYMCCTSAREFYEKFHPANARSLDRKAKGTLTPEQLKSLQARLMKLTHVIS